MLKREPDPRAKDLTKYRPFEIGWIEDLIRNEYSEVYPTLSTHKEGFPTPGELLSKVYYGNYWFEGDVRYESEGSRLIEKCIMDERTDTLYLQSWGGVNTIVRALLSIYEKNSAKPEWPDICKKVTEKIAILGVMGGHGQDNSFLDNEIPAKFPGIRCLTSDFAYVSFMSANSGQEDLVPLIKSDYMYSHFKVNHGPLLAKYGLFGDGTIFRGECDRFQYGLNPVIDWGFGGMPPMYFDQYDLLGEGDSNTYIPLFTSFGLRGMEDWRYGTLLGILHIDDMKPIDIAAAMSSMGKGEAVIDPFIKAYHEDFAARADWCVRSYDEANHNPVVTLSEPDINALPGSTVTLSASVSDVRPFTAKWWLYQSGCAYSGNFENVQLSEENVNGSDYTVSVKIPEDAAAGDFFNVILEARNEHENPMTGYGQIIIHII